MFVYKEAIKTQFNVAAHLRSLRTTVAWRKDFTRLRIRLKFCILVQRIPIFIRIYSAFKLIRIIYGSRYLTDPDQDGAVKEQTDIHLVVKHKMLHS